MEASKMNDFITDEEMQKLESGEDFISDEQMAAMEAAPEAPKDPGFGPTADGSMRNPLDVDWIGAIKNEFTKPMDPSAKAALENPLMGAAGPAASAAVGAGGNVAKHIATRFATSPLPKKVSDATNVVGAAKGMAGKFLGLAGDNLPPAAKRITDLVSGTIGRKAAYSNPVTAIPQGISDVAKGVTFAQKGMATALDKGAPLISGATKAVGAAAGAASAKPLVNRMLEESPDRLGKFAPALQSAAQRGESALASTHFLLSQSDPEYQAIMKENQE